MARILSYQNKRNTAKSPWASGGREHCPALGELSELGLSPLGGAGMQLEAGAMLTDTLLFLAQVVCCDARERSGGIRQGAGMRQEFPSAHAARCAGSVLFGRWCAAGGG